jgi:hypothetical protein
MTGLLPTPTNGLKRKIMCLLSDDELNVLRTYSWGRGLTVTEHKRKPAKAMAHSCRGVTALGKFGSTGYPQHGFQPEEMITPLNIKWHEVGWPDLETYDTVFIDGWDYELDHEGNCGDRIQLAQFFIPKARTVLMHDCMDPTLVGMLDELPPSTTVYLNKTRTNGIIGWNVPIVRKPVPRVRRPARIT